MSTLYLRQRLINIAKLDVNKTEVSRNQAPWIKKFWPFTSYGASGHTNREPYCAAAVSYWVAQWLKDPEVLAALKMTPKQAEAFRCKSARAFDWLEWGKSKKLLVMNDSSEHVLHTGDVVIYDFSHIGIVYDDAKDRIMTVEANTGPAPGNEGDGCYLKNRPREVARGFVRILA